MLWRLTLAVAAVCVAGMCGCTQADQMSRLIMPRDYGVKLCGREFIRAVIFTCGGSRWRRSADGDADPFQWSSLSFATDANHQQLWQRGAELSDRLPPLPPPPPPPHPRGPSHSLPDLLSLFRAASDRQQQLNGQNVNEDSQTSEDPGASDFLPLNMKKRNFSLGVAGMCCTQGCTKNDIGRLC